MAEEDWSVFIRQSRQHVALKRIRFSNGGNFIFPHSNAYFKKSFEKIAGFVLSSISRRGRGCRQIHGTQKCFC